MAAFLFLGLLVGNLIGLSAQSTVVPFLGLVFALAGGSLIAFLEKLAGANRKAASRALAAFSLAALVGVYLGVVISEWQLLSPASFRRTPSLTAEKLPTTAAGQPASAGDRLKIEERKYLRASQVSAIHEIDRQYHAGHLKADEAYEGVFKVCTGTEE